LFKSESNTQLPVGTITLYYYFGKSCTCGFTTSVSLFSLIRHGIKASPRSIGSLTTRFLLSGHTPFMSMNQQAHQ